MDPQELLRVAEEQANVDQVSIESSSCFCSAERSLYLGYDTARYQHPGV